MIGTEYKEGQECQKWRKVDQIGKKVNKYTMWLKEAGGVVVPIKYEMKGYNTLLGSHYDHYYLKYTQFSPEKPTHWKFEKPKGMKCHGFPGPGVEAEHIYTMNPAKEFIEGHTGHVDETFSSWKTQ